MTTEERVFKLFADTEAKRKKWVLAIHVMIEYLSNKGDTKGEFHGEILRFEAATTGINARLSDGVEGMQGNLRETFLGASRDFNLAMADHKKKMDVLVRRTLASALLFGLTMPSGPGEHDVANDAKA